MPNDAQKFTPTERAILISLYRWEYDPPADERYGYKSALPAVPYDFLVADLLEVEDDGRYPRKSSLWNDEADLAMKSLGVTGLIRHFGSDHSLGWYDRGCDEYRHFSDSCEGAWRLRNGLLLICGFRIEQEDDVIQIEDNFRNFYKLSETGMPITRQLYFASMDQPSETVETARPRVGRDESSGATLADRPKPPQLNRIEQDILEALSSKRMTGEPLATAAGYSYDATFKQTLAAMVRHGILINCIDSAGRGYELARQLSQP